jgi:hypothetical protein
MAKILLDYFFKITAINPTPAASTAFLKQACVVVTPKGGYMGADGDAILCTTNAQIAAITDNTEAQQLLAGGLSRVYIMPVDDLYLADFLEAEANSFFTLLISSDFDKDDINDTAAAGTVTISSYANLLTTTPDTVTVNGIVFTAQSGAATLGTGTFRAATSNDATAASLAAQINAHASLSSLVIATVLTNVVTITALDSGSGGNALTLAYADLGGGNIGASVSGATLTGGDGLFLGTFDGVVGVVSSDKSFLATQAAIENRCAFYEAGTTNGKNLMYAFGKLLSNTLDWKNQQYITMPFADDADILGDAEALFDDKISFVISDDEFGNRLALLACGGKSIVAPYIIRNLEIDLQSKGLQYISANQPAYTLTQAALLEDELQKVIDGDGLENGNPGYVGKGWITEGTVRITLEEDNFVAAGRIAVPTPRSLWRIDGQLTQS